MSTDEQTIRDLVALWHRATAAGDIDTVLTLMAEDVVFLVAVLTQNRIESTGNVQEIGVSGDLAYCWTVLTVRIIPLDGGDAMVRTGSALSILRKQSDGSWVIVRDANLLSPMR